MGKNMDLDKVKNLRMVTFIAGQSSMNVTVSDDRLDEMLGVLNGVRNKDPHVLREYPKIVIGDFLDVSEFASTKIHDDRFLIEADAVNIITVSGRMSREDVKAIENQRKPSMLALPRGAKGGGR